MKKVNLYILDTNKYSVDELISSFNYEKEKVKNFLNIKSEPKIKEKIGSFILKEKFVKDYKIEKNGKPISSLIYFNISHSNGIVVIALSNDSNIGVDLELIRPINKHIIKRISNEEEFKYIIDDESFFKIWTSKESYLKMSGEGITNNLDKVPSFLSENLKISRFCRVFKKSISENEYIFSISLEGNEDFDIKYQNLCRT